MSKIETKEIDHDDYDITQDEIQIFLGYAELNENNMISQTEYLRVVQLFQDKIDIPKSILVPYRRTEKSITKS